MAHSISSLFTGIEPDEHAEFKLLFDEYYRPLTSFALDYVGDLDTARDIVQGFFVKLWELRHLIKIEISVKAYFYQSVKNACYNYIKSKNRPTDLKFPVIVVEDDVLEHMIATETKEKLYKAIEKLPDRCKLIFKMSRIKQLKHAEIAHILNISEKTIESQIRIALKRLLHLKTVLLLLFFLTLII